MDLHVINRDPGGGYLVVMEKTLYRLYVYQLMDARGEGLG